MYYTLCEILKHEQNYCHQHYISLSQYDIAYM